MSNNEKEIELKLCVDANSMEHIFAELSKYAINDKIKAKHRPRAYFDTKNRDISKARMALRVQYKDELGYEQTLKYEISNNSNDIAVMARVEVKNILPEKQKKPDLALIDINNIDDKRVANAISAIQNKKLQHIFTSSVKRRYFSMPVFDGEEEIAVVELAFDKGVIIHATEKDLSYDVLEIEIELKSGDAKAVEIVAEQILEISSTAKISSVSKAEQGYILDKIAIDRANKSKEVMKAVKKDCATLDKKSKKMLPKNK